MIQFMYQNEIFVYEGTHASLNWILEEDGWTVLQNTSCGRLEMIL